MSTEQTVMPAIQPLREWAGEHPDEARPFVGRIEMDNHDPVRTVAFVDCLLLADGRMVVFANVDAPVVKIRSAIFIVDDGRTVTPFWAGSYNDREGWVIANLFPTDYGADGARRMRADSTPEHPRPVDFSTWALGPRTALHMKVPGRVTC